mgnify:CR=1 FL=1
MENKKRLIDANALIQNHGNDVTNWDKPYAVKISSIENAPTVDAVEVEKYIELREQYDKVFTEYHELRDAFVSYVCGGIPNPSPFCKNSCGGCVDGYGWCKFNDKCRGFNPAEVLVSEERSGNE